MPTFHSPRNPNFKLSSSRLPKAIVFTDGAYSTDDPAEVKALRRHVKAGTLVEGEAGEFHSGGVIPAEGLLTVGAGCVSVPAGTEVAPPDETAGYAVVSEKPADVGVVEVALEGRDRADLSNRELREHAEALGITVPRSAGKKALLDAIEIAEQESTDDEAEGDDFDPNDPDGS